MRIDPETVYDLDPGEVVGCYYCMREPGRCQDYTRGEAFLAGPGHPPYDANANYMCRNHCDPDVRVWDPVTKQERDLHDPVPETQ